MNKHFLLLLTPITLLLACNNPDVVIVEKWGNGEPKCTLLFRNRKDSTYTRTDYFPTGQVQATHAYAGGKLNGKEVVYSEDGAKLEEFNYVNGKKEGIGTAWYKSGKVAYQFKFKDGLHYDGTEYFEDGYPRVLVKFSAPGKREGKALYYRQDGSRKGILKTENPTAYGPTSTLQVRLKGGTAIAMGKLSS